MNWKEEVRDWWYKYQDRGYDLPEEMRVGIERIFRNSIDMAFEEGKKNHECIRHECALYIKHCKENHIPHCSRCFAKCPECNKSLT